MSMPTKLASAAKAPLTATLLLPSHPKIMTDHCAGHSGIGIADSSGSPENLFEHKPGATVFAWRGKDVTG